MITECIEPTPFEGIIYKHLALTNSAVEAQGDIVEILSAILFSTKNFRYGPMPSIESQYRIRTIIRQAIERGKPIPILVPWGSIKSDFTDHVDLAEWHALVTLSNLSKKIQEYYAPGLHINIRVEDWSGENLFALEENFSSSNSISYCKKFSDLVTMFNKGCSYSLHVKKESEMQNRGKFNDLTQHHYEYLLAYLIESKDLIKESPERIASLVSYNNLRAIGWSGVISKEQRDYYLNCYGTLYAGDELSMLKRLALYFAGSLSREILDMRGTEPGWAKDYIQISFTPPIKNLPNGYNDHYIYYRTMPMNQCRTHCAPWRGVGYLSISNDGSTKSKIASYSQLPDEMEIINLLVKDDTLSTVLTLGLAL